MFDVRICLYAVDVCICMYAVDVCLRMYVLRGDVRVVGASSPGPYFMSGQNSYYMWGGVS